MSVVLVPHATVTCARTHTRTHTYKQTHSFKYLQIHTHNVYNHT